MIKIKVDTHTHTLASVHAFSTIEENVKHAREQEMDAIVMTDHFGPMFWPNGKPIFDSQFNMPALPKEIYGVRVFVGTEIDIVDFDGNLAGHDISFFGQQEQNWCDYLLDTREITIASHHFFKGMEQGTVEQYTQMYCNVAKNPKVNIIGHCGRMGFLFDIEKVVLAAKENGKCIEINNSTLKGNLPAEDRCRQIALACAKNNVPIVVSSDAHSAFLVGIFDKAIKMLEDIDFPESLIMNTSMERFMNYFNLY